MNLQEEWKMHIKSYILSGVLGVSALLAAATASATDSSTTPFNTTQYQVFYPANGGSSPIAWGRTISISFPTMSVNFCGTSTSTNLIQIAESEAPDMFDTWLRTIRAASLSGRQIYIAFGSRSGSCKTFGVGMMP
jgi:hypothetical protein